MGKKQGKHPHKQLTAVAVRNLAKPGRYADGNGLYLVVDPSGAKRWVLRVVVHGKRRDIGLGGLRTVPLMDARAMAEQYRRIARDGGDPLDERDRSARVIPTFEQAARKLYSDLLPSWKNAKHGAQWIGTLEQYVFPHFGSKRVDLISPDDVTGALLPIWFEKPETARRVRQRIRLVMDAVIESKYRADNPANVKVRLPAQSTRPQHHTALPYADVPAFVRELREHGALESAKLALEFLILTVARTNEVLGAQWDEIDLEGAIWTIPAERMKAKAAHRVSLAPRAVAILREAQKLSDGSSYVFPGRSQGTPLSSMTLLQIVRRMDYRVTVHGFRSSFRDWTEERTNFPNNVCESALAHVVKDKAERAYRRTDYFDKRKKLMAMWAQFVTSGSAKVVPLQAKA